MLSICGFNKHLDCWSVRTSCGYYVVLLSTRALFTAKETLTMPISAQREARNTRRRELRHIREDALRGQSSTVGQRSNLIAPNDSLTNSKSNPAIIPVIVFRPRGRPRKLSTQDHSDLRNARRRELRQIQRDNNTNLQGTQKQTNELQEQSEILPRDGSGVSNVTPNDSTNFISSPTSIPTVAIHRLGRRPRQISADHSRDLRNARRRELRQIQQNNNTSMQGICDAVIDLQQQQQQSVDEPCHESVNPTSPTIVGPHIKITDSGVQSLDSSDIQSSEIKKKTASKMLLSKQTIPHCFLTADARVNELIELLNEYKSLPEGSGGKCISVEDFVIKAVALVLQKVPQCNSFWINDSIHQYHNVNINIAVQTKNGMYLPVIRDADKKSVFKLAEEAKDLAQKAKEDGLRPEDLEGGTFTVSNLGGSLGTKQFCTTINPSQSCILIASSAEKRVIPGARPHQFDSGSFISVMFKCDHRIVDGAIGAEFLKAFKDYLEYPISMLL